MDKTEDCKYGKFARVMDAAVMAFVGRSDFSITHRKA